MSYQIARWLAFLWLLLILIACSIPGRDIPSVDIVQIDKAVHFSLFAVLGWLVMHAFGSNLLQRILWTVGIGIAYAVGTEFYQGLLPFERTPDPVDALANTLGLLTAVAVFYIRYRRVELANRTVLHPATSRVRWRTWLASSPMRTSEAMPRKRPWSRTPGID